MFFLTTLVIGLLILGIPLGAVILRIHLEPAFVRLDRASNGVIIVACLAITGLIMAYLVHG